MFIAHVEETFEAAHANGPAGHKCQVMHGHSWKVEIEWGYSPQDLSEYGWGVDFGQVKALIRVLDHRNLNDTLTFPPSSENIARSLYRQVKELWPFVLGLKVKIHEGHGNTVLYTG